MISLLKEVENEGIEPLFDELPILNIGGRGRLTSTNEGESWCLDDALTFAPLGSIRSKRGRALCGSWVSTWACPTNLTGEGALSPELPYSRWRGFKDSFCSIYHQVSLPLDVYPGVGS